MIKLTLLFTFLVLTSSGLYAKPSSSESNATCPVRAEYVYSDLNNLWGYVKNYPRSSAKDAIYTTTDFAGVYSSLMRRMPGREDRTRGIYLELRDRFNYMYDRATRYPWQDAAIYNTLEISKRDMIYLSRCYPSWLESNNLPSM